MKRKQKVGPKHRRFFCSILECNHLLTLLLLLWYAAVAVGGRMHCVVVVHKLLQVGQLLVQILKVVPGLLPRGVLPVALVLTHNLVLDPLKIWKIINKV